MLININGDIVIETDLVIGFVRTNFQVPGIVIYMNGLNNNSSYIKANFDSAESRDAAFQKLEKLLKVNNL